MRLTAGARISHALLVTTGFVLSCAAIFVLFQLSLPNMIFVFVLHLLYNVLTVLALHCVVIIVVDLTCDAWAGDGYLVYVRLWRDYFSLCVLTGSGLYTAYFQFRSLMLGVALMSLLVVIPGAFAIRGLIYSFILINDRHDLLVRLFRRFLFGLPQLFQSRNTMLRNTSVVNESEESSSALIGDGSSISVDYGAATSTNLPLSPHPTAPPSLPDGGQAKPFSSLKSVYSASELAPSAVSEEENTCKICFDHVIATVSYPCGHSAMCVACAKVVAERKECPICRAKIVDIIRIHR
jgi:hypothetical protein